MGVSKLTFQVLALLQGHDKGLMLQNFSLETLKGGQFTSSTQLIIPNYFFILSHQPRTTVSLEPYPLYSFISCHRSIVMLNASQNYELVVENYHLGSQTTNHISDFSKWLVLRQKENLVWDKVFESTWAFN